MPSSSSANLEAGAATSPPADSYVLVAATFTADPVRDTLEFWLRELAISLPVKFAPYNQVFQQLLDPASRLATNQKGINLILIRYEDWAHAENEAALSLEELEENVKNFLTSVSSAAPRLSSPTIVALCPSSPEFTNHPRNLAIAARLDEAVASILAGLPGFHLLPTEELLQRYPVERYFDEHGNELGHVPYTSTYFAAVGTVLARKMNSLLMPPYKVIVLDCDDTLWRGICGEDGPRGVVIDEPHRKLQELMLAQREAGMLLCLCSKNNEEDVLETFRAHPDMVLTLDHFTARRINWEPKSSNLRSLSAELLLGLSSFILVDDNHKECAEVQANCPEVLTLPLPGNVEEIPAFLENVWAFDHAKITQEDRERSALYAQQAERSRAERESLSLGDFIRGLQLQVHVAPPVTEQLPRIAQLTQRTNQFNCSTIRRNEAEIAALLRSQSMECLAVEVRDRFGAYGLTGMVLFHTADDAIKVDTFLLSCRVLGRGVEHRVLAHLGALAQERGLARVDILFRPTAKNKPALTFLESIAEAQRVPMASGAEFRIPAAAAAAATYDTSGPMAAIAAHREAPSPKDVAASRAPVDYARIARTFQSAPEIRDHIRRDRMNRQSPASVSAAPRTPLEREVAEMWRALLGLPVVGIHDDFFDLGGNSLLGVQLLSKVRNKYNVDLSLEVLYGGSFTIAELTKAIELDEFSRAEAGEYADLLDQLENLSDEEVRSLLAEEGDAESGA